MLNETILLKIKERINKLYSQDYTNIECWILTEAFNKAQVSWCRRQLVGTNILKQGDEQSKRRVDDLQVLLVDIPQNLTKFPVYYESTSIPADYFEYKHIEA